LYNSVPFSGVDFAPVGEKKGDEVVFCSY